MGSPGNVVLIDDEDRLVRVVCSWLESLGFTAHGFTLPADALAYLATSRADVVITGAHVADMSGTQLCACVRGLSDRPPPAFVALARETDGVAARAGYDAIVARPAPLDSLLHAITRLVPGERSPTVRAG